MEIWRRGTPSNVNLQQMDTLWFFTTWVNQACAPFESLWGRFQDIPKPSDGRAWL